MSKTLEGVLRRILESACEEHKASLTDPTVLSAQVDPYRIDTVAGHRDGQWLAEQLAKLYGSAQRAHWRGIHYRHCRRRQHRQAPWRDLPEHAFHFAIFGEKSSLEDVVLPIAEQFEADLYLPTGEISDTLVYQIAKEANDDGRPLVMFTLSDCDPAGHQMPVSIARKLQAFHDLFFPNLRFEVVRVALTPEQVEAEDLPSTPLKATEKRASRWRDAFGIRPKSML
jgi:hypothetical protein